jgi:hypothetical protein
MKKALLIAAIFCLTIVPAFAANGTKNLQKIYPVNSDVYQAITCLYLDQGLGLPSTAGPWSGDELVKMLDKIDSSKLSGGAIATYNYALGALNEGQKTFKFNLKTTVEGYYHTNTHDFTKESQWIRGFDERNPILDLVLETWPSEHFYGFSSLPVMNNRYRGFSSTEGYLQPLWGSSALTTNIPLVAPNVLDDLNMNSPYRAFGAFGGSGWSVEIGRDKYSWGPGVSGNFILGDQVLYHNMGRITTYGKNFKYTFATSFFPYPTDYEPAVDGSGNYIQHGSQDTLQTGTKMFIGHRLEWKAFGSKLGFVVNEAIMYQSATNSLDLRVLSPTAIFHDYYIRSNANSMIGAEVDYTPLKYVNLYGQVVVDEFCLPGEPVPGVDADALPSALGYMAGAKGSVPYGKGMLFGSVEWAKTDPYLYLRDNGDRNQTLGDYSLNWVVAIREFNSTSGISYTTDFLGYQYGCDAIVCNGHLGYKQFGTWSLEGNVFYMIHGTHDQWTTWGKQSDSAQDTETTPTLSHVTANNADIHADERNCASYTFVVGARGGYTVLKGLEVFGQVDYIHITNPGNISTNPAIWDVQVTAGVKYSF